MEEKQDLEEEIEEKEPWYKGPIKWILGLFLVLILISWYIPYSTISLDPSPSYIPKINEVFSYNETVSENYNHTDYLKLIQPENPIIKQTANKIITLSNCKESRVCNAKAIFYFVRNNLNYINDPINRDYLADPISTLQSQAGDCDDFSILLSNLLQSIGIKTRFVFITGHVYIQAQLKEAMKKYKSNLDWVNLDPTCNNCEFSQIPVENINKYKTYIG